MNWTTFYLGLAFVYAQKSHDEETKHGCVITNQKNRPIGFGFNGFPSSINDSDLPRTRPEKYNWMYHAEENAIANCEHKPVDAIAYITGRPCTHCLKSLWQNGIRSLIVADTPLSKMLSKEDEDFFWQFINKTNMFIRITKPDLTWLYDVGNLVMQNGFYTEIPI